MVLLDARGGPGTSLADSPGLAILVTCDYEGTASLSTMSGTNNDFEKMKATFKHLNYVIHTLQNEEATRAKILAKVDEISRQPKRGEYLDASDKKVIIFAFSGHGTNRDEHEHIISNDGKMISLMHQIIQPLVTPGRVAAIPKLFLIDACRGSHHITDGEVPDGASKNLQSAQGPGDDISSTKKFFPEIVAQIEGNYRIDYCTIPDHVSYSVPDEGSIWMPKLAEAMVTVGYSFQNVAEEVRKTVYDEKLTGSMFYLREQCETDGILKNPGILYLTKAENKPIPRPLSSGTTRDDPLNERKVFPIGCRGLAILVTCDYKGSGIYELDDVKVEAEEMKKIFEELKYKTYPMVNKDKGEIVKCLENVSKDLSEYDGQILDRVIAFAFAGHGCSQDLFEHIMANDGKKLNIMDEVVLPLVKHEAVAKIPKLFLIDTCHRGNSIDSMEEDCFEKNCDHTFGQSCTKPTSTASGATSTASAATPFVGPKKKGSKPWVVGNFRIDYSIIAGHNTAFGTGSIWMRTMIREMNSKDTYPDIAAKVSHIVSQKTEGPKQLVRDVDRLDMGAAFYL